LDAPVLWRRGLRRRLCRARRGAAPAPVRTTWTMLVASCGSNAASVGARW